MGIYDGSELYLLCLHRLVYRVYHSALAFVGIRKRMGTDKHQDTGGVAVCVIQDSGIL